MDKNVKKKTPMELNYKKATLFEKFQLKNLNISIL